MQLSKMIITVFGISEILPNVVRESIPVVPSPSRNAAFALYFVKKLFTQENHHFHK
jgi:hypothetical protein